MKKLLALQVFILFFSAVTAQQMTLDEWNEEAKTNIRLLPKYGNVKKLPGQLQADAEFIKLEMDSFATKRLASEKLIDLGFYYLYHNIKTAMYRFNQAYLLDSTNSNIYWGYGGIYLMLEDYPRARAQYEEGLSLDSLNTRILTDFGTYFSVNNKNDSAIQYLAKSYSLDSTNQNTLFKLSVCYYYNDDCKNAVYYYEKCKSLGGRPISKEFEDALKIKCMF